MKTIILISFCFLIFLSCSTSEHELVASICNELYSFDHENTYSYIKTPIETINDHAGDCADLTALLAYRLTQNGIYDFTIVTWDVPDTDVGHMNLRYHGVYYDPAIQDWPNFTDGWEIMGEYSWVDLWWTFKTRGK